MLGLHNPAIRITYVVISLTQTIYVSKKFVWRWHVCYSNRMIDSPNICMVLQFGCASGVILI